MSTVAGCLRRRIVISVVTCVIALFAAGCGKKKPPIVAPVKRMMTITTSADVNPDDKGTASPVVVRIYQLTSDKAFNEAEFFALYDDDKKTLGSELVKVDEYVLKPSDHRTIELPIAADAQFLAAAAAFRDIRNAQWRRVVPSPKKNVTVQVGRADVSVIVAN